MQTTSRLLVRRSAKACPSGRRTFCGLSRPMISDVLESSAGKEYSFITPQDELVLKRVLHQNQTPLSKQEIIPVYDRLVNIGFDSAGAVYILHCLSSLPDGNGHPLLRTVIKRIEEEYFSSNPGWLTPSSPFARILYESGLVANKSVSFQSVVADLPLKCKALIMGFREEKTRSSSRPSAFPTSGEIEARWHTLDPVDMEDVERKHYLKTGKILRTRHVEANPSAVRTGARIAQVLGMECLDRLPDMNIDDLSLLLEAMLLNGKNCIYHRDFKSDAQFAISKRLLTIPDQDVGRYLLTVALSVSKFEPELEILNRVWNRKIIPTIRRGVAKVSTCPKMYENLNEVSRQALLCSTILASGRVRVTDRLMSYFSSHIVKRLIDIDDEIINRLLDSFTRAGYLDQDIVSGISGDTLSLPTLVLLIQTRSHFGLFGKSYEALVDDLTGRLESTPDIDSAMSPSDQLMMLNCVMSGSHLRSDSDTVSRLAKRIFAKHPDFEIDRIGRLASVLE